MKKISLLFFLIAAALIVSCSGNSGKSEKKHNPKFDNYAEIDGRADTTLYVTVLSSDSDSISVKVMETGRKMSFSLTPAQINNAIYGDMDEGDSLAIMPDFKSKTVLSVINTNIFNGTWWFKDKEGEGLRLNSDGTAQSIGWEDEDVSLRHWKIYNGKLYLYTIPADGSSYAELPFECTIEYASDDHFVFVEQGDRYDCYKNDELIVAKVK